MAHFPAHAIAGVAVLTATLALQAFTANRLVRRKLRLSVFVLIAFLALDLFLVLSPAAPGAQAQSFEHLLFALALINLIVVAALNPITADRVPDRFPAIVQDALIVGAFLLIATFVMQEKLLTTSAVGAVVVGFALQDTLGNAFAGLAIQVEKPFRVGHWIQVAGFEGRVAEITWRATKLQTKTGNFVIVPNNVMSKEAITNYSEPAVPTRIELEVGVSYDAPPNEVKAVVREALGSAPDALASPPPDILLVDFASSAIAYRVRFWVADFARDEIARDQVRTAIYYAFRRRGIEIPFPIQVEIHKDAVAKVSRDAEQRAALLERVPLFAPLGEPERLELAASARERPYGAGEVVVRQNDPGESMFVVFSGRVRVAVGPAAGASAGQEVATIGPGDYFGEMSLLTGEPRTATVTAVEDCELLEIGAEDVRRLVLSHPGVVDEIGRAMLQRRDGLETARAAVAASVLTDDHETRLLSRIRKFLRL